MPFIVTLGNWYGRGFFSDTFKIAHAVLLARKYKDTVYINSYNWLFKIDKGWEDWFDSFHDEIPEHTKRIKYYDSISMGVFQDFSLKDYREVVPQIFKYNTNLLEEVAKAEKELDLKTPYAAIFIRWGDKLQNESIRLDIGVYGNKVFEKFPDCNTIFLQTDDIRAVNELRNWLEKTNRSSVRVVSTCPETKFGAFVFQFQPQIGSEFNSVDLNKEYFESYSSLQKQKPVCEYTKEEMEAHVKEMLIGLELCRRAKGVVLDTSSNAARYIVLSHTGGFDAIWAVNSSFLFEDNTVILPPYFDFKESTNA